MINIRLYDIIINYVYDVFCSWTILFSLFLLSCLWMSFVCCTQFICNMLSFSPAYMCFRIRSPTKHNQWINNKKKVQKKRHLSCFLLYFCSLRFSLLSMYCLPNIPQLTTFTGKQSRTQSFHFNFSSTFFLYITFSSFPLHLTLILYVLSYYQYLYIHLFSHIIINSNIHYLYQFMAFQNFLKLLWNKCTPVVFFFFFFIILSNTFSREYPTYETMNVHTSFFF